MARGARSTPLRATPGGRLASKRSKTGDPACSQAMSTWVRNRKGGNVPAEVFAILGKCRAKARMLKAAEGHASAGRGLKAQAMQARAARGLGVGQRQAEARRLRGELAKRRAARAAEPSSREIEDSIRRFREKMAGPPEPRAAAPSRARTAVAVELAARNRARAARSVSAAAPGRSDRPFAGHHFEESRAAVHFEAGAREHASKILGREVTPGQLASLAGAPHDAHVRIASPIFGSEHSFEIHVEHPGFEAQHRTVTKDASGEIHIHNDIFKLKKGFRGREHANPEHHNLALKSFARQVQHAHTMGIHHIDTFAFRNKRDPETDSAGRVVMGRDGKPVERWAGYYVWPRYGYQGRLDFEHTQKLKEATGLPKSAREAKRIEDLMKTKAGREWWKEHGDAIHVSFGLDKGSGSLRTLNRYLKEELPEGRF